MTSLISRPRLGIQSRSTAFPCFYAGWPPGISTTEPEVSSIFPSGSSMLRRRPLFCRVRWVGSPTSSLVSRRSRSPDGSACRFASPFRPTTPETRDLPSSWVTLVRVPRASRTPVRRRLRTPGELPLRFELDAVAFHAPSRVGRDHDLISGLTLVAHSPAVYASQPPSRCRPRKTRSPAALLSLTGTGFSPARSLLGAIGR